MYSLLIGETMKRTLIALLLAASAPAFADSYQVTFGWTDPTTYIASDAPVYSAKYRIAGGTETTISSLATPGGTFNATATPGQTIEVAMQTCNIGLCSSWTGWITATAQHPPTQPEPLTGGVITVVRTGP